ncbi:MAG TPA: GntG family PLP-dependent aldolase [Niabella sp.]|nr:GntG family PLP-dependent aldolase [Niabella sp.]HOZ98105.1 GntG family PLP-dependent aldolase [Niabella sp.]HQW16151.1 GntG family PLP-dependent aldolase [Niabella sp.]HQX21363.1 GntG family PLP-dependent aldolase [Niabella sp.]HQX42239.1 GntG family PLP-dependent aldolase [Niabella sp.]
MNSIIDFRSDTVTKPSPAMQEAMMKASVGDDVFGEDPSVNELERRIANMFGVESALFCPSGTMTNQIAIKCHTQPGDEIICDLDAHIYQYEGGGIAFNSGCSVKLLHGNRGRINAQQVLEAIQPDDVHRPHSRLVCVENTSNRGGGSCYDFVELEKIKQVCVSNNLAFHIDGARLFNALLAKKESPKQYGQLFDSLSVCLSKSLGCPVGSLLLGDAHFIKKARRIRKVFGGGMRQAGFLAAAGVYALQNNIDRLENDHQHAIAIAEALQNKSFVASLLPIETNIIIFETNGISASELVEKLKTEQILCYAIGPNRIRLVLHLDITEEMVGRTIEVMRKFG